MNFLVSLNCSTLPSQLHQKKLRASKIYLGAMISMCVQLLSAYTGSVTQHLSPGLSCWSPNQPSYFYSCFQAD